LLTLRVGKPHRGRRFRFVPGLEVLEDRWVPAIVTWIGPNVGDWDTPANWSTGTLPRPQDDVVIDSPDVTVVHVQPIQDDVQSLSAAGAVQLLGGSLSVGDGTLQDLTVAGGQLDVSDGLESDGQFTWSGGAIRGPGVIFAAGALTITGPTPKLLDTVQLINFNVGSWDGGPVAAAGGAALINTDFALFTAGGVRSFDPDVYNGGQLLVDPSVGIVRMHGLYNLGMVDVQGGSLEAGPFVQSGGVTFLSGGSLFSPEIVTLSGGSLVGPGVVAADLYNDADVNASSGEVVVLGNYSQTSHASLEVALSGIPSQLPAPLTVEGVAALGGTLNVDFPGGVVASPGERFVVLTAAGISGQFDAIAIASPPGGATLLPVYEAGAVTLVGAGAQQTGAEQLSPETTDLSGDLLDALPMPLAPPSPPDILGREALAMLQTGGELGATGFSGQGPAGPRETTFAGAGAADASAVRDSTSTAAGPTGDEPPLVLLEDGDGTFTVALEVEPAVEEITSAGDLASTLLTGGRSRVDVLPQQGSPVAAVATLLADEGEEAGENPGRSAEEGLDVEGLLMNPVAGSKPEDVAGLNPLVVIGASALAVHRRRRTPTASLESASAGRCAQRLSGGPRA
jgi:hypothetical protein